MGEVPRLNRVSIQVYIYYLTIATREPYRCKYRLSYWYYEADRLLSSSSSALTFTEIMKRHARYLEINSQCPTQCPDNDTLALVVQDLNNGGNPSTKTRQISQSSARPQQSEEMGQSKKSITPRTEALSSASSLRGIRGDEGCLNPLSVAHQNETLGACDDLYAWSQNPLVKEGHHGHSSTLSNLS